MLEVGAVRGARRPDDHDRVLAAARGRGPQRLEQEGRVVTHGADVVLGEQLGEQAAHRDAVLEDVGDAGRRAHVVLEHLPAAVGVADEVAAGDVTPHAAGRADAVSLAGEVGSRDDELPGDDPLFQDLLAVVDVLDEGVQRAHALGEAALDDAPLVGGQDARDEVERERPVAALRAVGGGGVEGDALLDEDGVAPLAGRLKPLAAQPGERAGKRGRLRARGRRALEELVEEAGRGGVVELCGGRDA